MRRAKLVLAALTVAVAAFMAFSGPVMAVECEHTDERGVIECGKNDNVFLSEERFFDHGFHDGIDTGFIWSPFVFGDVWFEEEVPVLIGSTWCELDWEDNEVEC